MTWGVTGAELFAVDRYLELPARFSLVCPPEARQGAYSDHHSLASELLCALIFLREAIPFFV